MLERTVARSYISPRVVGAESSLRLLTTVPVVTTLLAFVLWAVSLTTVSFAGMNDLGLISVLPPVTLIAPLVVIAGFLVALQDRSPSKMALLFHLTIIIVMLYGITSFIEDAPRFQSAWRHVGVTESIARTGQVDPTVDAYFNWPGFFVLGAFVADIAGMNSVLSFLPWAPIVLNLLFLGPLFIILNATTRDERLVWTGALIFCITNWVGQDYFSPQGFNFFLHLVIVAILFRWFQTPVNGDVAPWLRWQRSHRTMRRLGNLPVWRSPSSEVRAPSTASQRTGLILIVIILFGLVTMSHQLTPLFALTTVTLLVISGRCTARLLPILMLVMVLGWMGYMAETYMRGHLAILTGHVGQVSSTVNANFADRLGGSAEHTFVVRLRLATTILVWGLAFVGGIRRLRAHYLDMRLILIAAAPFLYLILQPYGGEMLMRVYLFALPAMAFFAAACFYPTSVSGRSWRTSLAVGLLCVGLLSLFVVARYGNERMDYFTPEEVGAVQHAYDVAEPGSLLISPTGNLPWKFQDYEVHDYLVLASNTDWIAQNATEVSVASLVQIMANTKYADSYLIVTRSQYAHAEMFGVLPQHFLERLEQDLRESSEFQVIYSSKDARVYALADPT